MAKYGSNAWVENMTRRRAVRDFYRKKFFEELGFGGRVLKTPFAFEEHSEEQIAAIMALFEKSKSGVGDDGDAIEQAKGLISSLGLGGGVRDPGKAALGLSFFDHSLTALAQTHFGKSEE